jgi:hypothetical protein
MLLREEGRKTVDVWRQRKEIGELSCGTAIGYVGADNDSGSMLVCPMAEQGLKGFGISRAGKAGNCEHDRLIMTIPEPAS